MTPRTPGVDPRLNADTDDQLALGDLQPVVGRAPGGATAALIGTGFVIAGGGLFLLLNSHRAHNQPSSLIPPASEIASVAPPTIPPPLVLPAASPTPPAPVRIPIAIPSPNFAPPAPPPPLGPPTVGPAAEGVQRQRAPTMVVDLGLASGEPARVQTAAGGAPAAGASASGGSAPAGGVVTPVSLGAIAGAAGGGAASEPQPGGDDQFAQRVGGDERPARSRAVTLSNLETLVPQGTIIPAALETAINSDLPGYTRAVVSRDVRSFDGKNVLIPRGSSVIGQYKSAVSQGASRAFVIWTRIIRSDGVSIQIGSPGTDPLGRGGLSGEVNRHFFTRFGGSILLSVLSAGVAAVSRTPSTNVTIGSPGAAVGAANSVQGDAIAPTITVAQGASVNIFVARDLDFSNVAAVK